MPIMIVPDIMPFITLRVNGLLFLRVARRGGWGRASATAPSGAFTSIARMIARVQGLNSPQRRG